MSPRTYTHTWTLTRLESIQDQFRFLLEHGGISQAHIEKVVYGVQEKAIKAVGLYATDSSGLRVIEVELSVDWDQNEQLTLSAPTIESGLSGWDGRQTGEVKIAGRRFSEKVAQFGLDAGHWISLIPRISDDSAQYQDWCRRLNLGGTTPNWRGTPHEVPDTLLDLPEVNIRMRMAGD